MIKPVLNTLVVTLLFHNVRTGWGYRLWQPSIPAYGYCYPVEICEKKVIERYKK